MEHRRRILLFSRQEDESRDGNLITEHLGRGAVEIFLPGADPLMSVAETEPSIIVFGSANPLYLPSRIVRSALLLGRPPRFFYLEEVPDLPSALLNLVEPFEKADEKFDCGTQTGSVDAPILAGLLELAEEARGVVPFARRAALAMGQQQTLLAFRDTKQIRWSLFQGGEGEILHSDGGEEIPNTPYLSERLAEKLIPPGIRVRLARIPPLVPLIRAGQHLTWLIFPEPNQVLTSSLLRLLRVTLKSLLYRTERQSRKESDARFGASANEVQGVTLDRGAVIRAVHPRIASVLGYTQGEMLGRRYFDFVPPEFRNLAIKQYLQLWAEQKPGAILDVVLDSAFGSRHTWEARIRAMEENQQMTLVELVDVTGLRTAVVESQRQLAILEKVVSVSPLPVIAADLNNRVILYNQQAERLLGWPAADILAGNPPVTSLYPTGIARQIMGQLKQDHRAGGPGIVDHFATTLRTKGGRELPVQLTVALLFDAGGQITGSVGIYLDQSELRRVQAENILLSTDTLQQTRDQVVRGLAGATSHKLNQPLQAIITGLELLQRFLDSEESRTRAERVLKHAYELRGLVQLLSTTSSYSTETYGEHTEILSIKEDS